jgi:hypothetical protein
MDESDVIQVKQLHVTAIVDDSPDPYGQPGFFGAFAKFEAADADLIAWLELAASAKAAIKVRCVMLEVTGPIGKIERSDGVVTVTVSVDGLRYAVPRGREKRGLNRPPAKPS